MALSEVKGYIEDVSGIAGLPLPWDKLRGKSFLISGAAGMIGSLLIDVLLYKNYEEDLGCTIYAIGRNREKLENRLGSHLTDDALKLVVWDINQPCAQGIGERMDYIVHLASNTHPVVYATDPIGTVMTNVLGTAHLLDIAGKNEGSRFLFASSVEIYGENRGDKELFDELYCGYINCNTLRAGYPESKRCGEALCQAYNRQRDVDVVIARLPRVFGPSMQMSDSKAIAQFIKKALAGEDIVLKSDGRQQYSFAYTADAVSGLLTVLLMGERGEAYNIADCSCDVTLRDLAGIVAETVGRKVVIQVPEDVEKLGYSQAMKALLDGEKLQKLGWHMRYDIRCGVSRAIEILSE